MKISKEVPRLKPQTERLLQAHEFARRAGVTVRTLHHYDRLGLLKPARTLSGYRMYGELDLVRLQQIVTLKFLGLPLKEIKLALERKPLDLQATLRLQREILGEKRRQIEMAIAAVEKAESLVTEKGEADWDSLKKIIEVIDMENNWDWVKKYYTEEQLAELASRYTPEVAERGPREWAALMKEVEAANAEGVDPASSRAQALAARWSALIEEFTGGNPEILENLKRLYADQANWPAHTQKPYSNDAMAFINRAIASRKKEE